MSQEIPLRWGSHHSTFFTAANNLRRADHLTDVILTASDNQQQFSAHKLVLSSCSGYFANLFGSKKSNQANQVPRMTVVHLNNVSPRHLDLILDYMYSGEVNVEEKELVAFLTAAKGLKVKGLVDIDTKNM